MIYVTSDTHAGHAQIMHFTRRPFASVEEMNQALIDNWNAVVTDADDVYHLGDFALGNKAFIRDFLSRLNGRIHLIVGNHDLRNIVGSASLMQMFAEVAHGMVLRHNHRAVFLSHYPYLCWPGTYDNAYQLHGHVHLRPGYTGADLRLMADVASPRQYDVGVDLNGFAPLTLDAALAKIDAQVEAGKNCYHMWCEP